MPSQRSGRTTAALAPIIALLTLSGAPANAYVKLNWACSENQSDTECIHTGGLKSIFIYGEIIMKDWRQLQSIDAQLPADHPFPKIYISSIGGSGRAAIQIGQILRRRHASIEGRDLFFPDLPAVCSSACVLLAAGAVDRQFDHIGVHRPHMVGYNDSCRPMTTELPDSDLDEDLAYFTEMGMPQKLFEYLKSTPSTRLTEFFYDHDSSNDEQMIVKFGFRMNPTAADAPNMFSIGGHPRFALAVDVMEKGVEDGNADVAYELGRMYHEGSDNHAPDIKTAILWYEKSAELGNHIAYHSLGVIFSNGDHVKINNKRATEYYRKAAEIGLAGSQNYLGWAYYKGYGVPKNYGLAIYWITRAVEQGEPFAYNSLGQMRLYAHGFPPDDVDAYKWLKLAEKSLPKGRPQVDNKHLLKILEKRMKAADVKRGNEHVEAWRPLKQTQYLIENKCNW
jgi:TPR repeat protein